MDGTVFQKAGSVTGVIAGHTYDDMSNAPAGYLRIQTEISGMIAAIPPIHTQPSGFVLRLHRGGLGLPFRFERKLVEMRGLEPLACTLRTYRSPT